MIGKKGAETQVRVVEKFRRNNIVELNGKWKRLPNLKLSAVFLFNKRKARTFCGVGEMTGEGGGVRL